MYPLSEGTVFDALYAMYCDADEIIIVLGEGSDEARERICVAASSNVRLVEMPSAGDLASTVLFGLEHLSNKSIPVVVNFSDTVADGSILQERDAFYCSTERFTNDWTFFMPSNGGIRVTYDRDPSALRQAGEGSAFVGVFRFDDPELFIKELDKGWENGRDGVTHFYGAVERYSVTRGLRGVKATDWLDIGHPTGYVAAQLQVKAREFNHIEVDRDRAILRKSSDDVDKFLGEVRWYLKLPSDVSYAAPRIFSYSLDYSDPWVEMEYYPYHTLNSLWLNGGLGRAAWARIFDKIAFLLDDFGRYRRDDSPENVRSALSDMYLTKTVNRLEMLKSDEHLSQLFNGPIMVNETVYPSLDDVEELLGRVVPERLCNPDAEICLIHGDLCFANVMVDQSYSFIKTVDPRGKFGPYDIYGDRRYELAKLAHSVDGKYDLIIKDRFRLSRISDASIKLSVDVPHGPELYPLMKECLSSQIGDHLAEVELIESLLFLSMVPLHRESLDHQLAMLATGLQLLDRSIGIALR